MPERVTTVTDELPFGIEDYHEKMKHTFITDPEWTLICERWPRSYSKKRRKPLEEFARGKLPGDLLEETLAKTRHAELGGRLGPVTVSSNAKFRALAVRAYYIRYRRENPTVTDEGVHRHVIDAFAPWMSRKTVYRHLKKQDPPLKAAETA